VPCRAAAGAALAVVLASRLAIAQPVEAFPGTKVEAHHPPQQPGVRFLPKLPEGPGADLPVVIEADTLYGRPDLESVAEGKVEFRRGAMTLKADRLEYQAPTDTARASGHVHIEHNGNTYSGPELLLQVQRFEGYFLSPTYFFGRLGAGGTAERFDFLGQDRGVATGATYTSCPPENPDWILRADRVTIDTSTDEGSADGAVLRFMGVPILAGPHLSFPLSDARKSGWLPPSVNLDNKSGLELSVPYYWNIAPNRDATFTPTLFSRRGAALDAEYRYLEPGYQGTVQGFALPGDREADRDRWALNFAHQARWEGSAVGQVDYGAAVQRASDDDFWKDINDRLPSKTPRLLPANAYAQRRFDSDWGDTVAYTRVEEWQTLQEDDLDSRIESPYQRSPQVGVRQRGEREGFEWTWEAEGNRFNNDDENFDRSLQTGSRLHALGSLARPWWPLGSPGWIITPRVSLNAASYDTEARNGDRTKTSRTIPTVSLDSAWVFERRTSFFGRELTQTLEPRLFYVNTPFKRQSNLPNFDSDDKDFNFTSIYSDNVFSGVDRVSDANQLTAGVTSRFLDGRTGAEALRLGVAQRLLLRDQRVTPDDGPPITQRWSDLLLLGATNLIPHWWLDGTVQYSADISRTVRSVLGARYSPGPFRTINAAYRYNRDQTEQIEVGWQWPLNEPAREHAAATLARDQQALEGYGPLAPRTPPTGCPGAWYTVGRVNYSQRDNRVNDALMGLEYDAGCWIGRMVAERQSTGRSQSTTRLLFQLELVGLSRLGSNPLKALRDNIPGYRLLREESPPVTPELHIP